MSSDEEIDALIEKALQRKRPISEVPTDWHVFTRHDLNLVARAAIEHGTRQALGGTLLSNAKASARAALARGLLERIDDLMLHIGAEHTVRSLKDTLRKIAEEGQ